MIGLSPEAQAKLARIEARQANRARLSRVRIAIDRIEAELAHGLNQKRQASLGGAENCREAMLLRRIESLRVDLDALEV